MRKAIIIISILSFFVFLILAALPVIIIIAGLGASAYNSKSLFWQLVKLISPILFNKYGLPLYYSCVFTLHIIGNIIIANCAKKI